ncbi:MAG: O-antigen ligase family protein, partial [Chloroflexota bacterium]
LFQGAVAAGQFLLQDDLGLRYLGEYDLVAEPGQWSIVFGQNRVWLRGYGISPHPNILGGLLGSALLIVFMTVQSITGRRWWWLGYAALFFGTAGLIVTFSRSAWLGFFVGFGFCFVAQFVQEKQLPSIMRFSPTLPILAALMVFIPLSMPVLQARSTPQENQVVTQSVGERQILNQYAIEVIRDNWALGQGAGNFAPAMLVHPDRDQFVNIHPVHNLPLLLIAELGILGGALWIWLMLCPVLATGINAWHGQANRFEIGVAAALVALAAVDLFDYYSYGWPHGMMWRWMLFGLFALAQISPRIGGAPLEADPLVLPDNQIASG